MQEGTMRAGNSTAEITGAQCAGVAPEHSVAADLAIHAVDAGPLAPRALPAHGIVVGADALHASPAAALATHSRPSRAVAVHAHTARALAVHALAAGALTMYASAAGALTKHAPGGSASVGSPVHAIADATVRLPVDTIGAVRGEAVNAVAVRRPAVDPEGIVARADDAGIRVRIAPYG